MSNVGGIREAGSNFGPIKCQIIQPWKAQLAGLIIHLMGLFEVSFFKLLKSCYILYKNYYYFLILKIKNIKYIKNDN